jgi:hypothetical protein
MRAAACRAVILAAVLPLLLLGQAGPPHIFYSDIDSGPNAGGENNAGAFVTIYGGGFGANRGSSLVTVGGGAVAAYKLWSDTRVSFQLGSGAQSGSIVVNTAGGGSNGVDFTVRAGNIYFVAVDGSDAAGGGFSTPWKTILKARNSIKPGDIVYVRNGVAQSTDDGEGWRACLTLGGIGGVSGKPLALVVYPGETATIGGTTTCGSGIRTKGQGENYWTFAGFNLRGTGEAIAAALVQGWRIVANDMTCPNGDGASACLETGVATYLKVYGNNVHDAGTVRASALYHGVYFSTDSNHVDFGWNTIANVHGCRGLQIHSSPLQGGGASDPTGHNQFDIRIHDNVIHDTQCDGIVLYTVDPSQGAVEVYNNVIYNAGQGPNNPEKSGTWSCVYVGAYTNTGPAGSGTVEVYNNTMYNCGAFANPPYSESSAGVLFAGPDANKSVRLRNNIIVMFNANVPYVLGATAAGRSCTTCTRISGSNNLLFGPAQAGSEASLTGTITANPLFTGAAAYDFRIVGTSPAASAGTDTGLATDIAGTPLNGVFPIGAYAAGGSGGTQVTMQVSPLQVSLQGGQSQLFVATVWAAANTSVTWILSPAVGTLSSTGLYTAPAVIGASQIVSVTARSNADSSVSDTAQVSLVPVSMTLAPAGGTLKAGQSLQFSARVSGSPNTAVIWSLNPQIGTISGSGLYTAPAKISTPRIVTVMATPVADASRSATAQVSLISDSGGALSLAFYPLSPCRLVDTRIAGGSADFGAPSLPAGLVRTFPLPQSPCGVASAQAYSLSVAVVPKGPLGFLTVWPAGTSQPLASNLNSAQGEVVANAAIVGAGTDGAISTYASDATDLVIDINGYFASPGLTGGSSFYSVSPCRILDTRLPTGQPSLAAGSTRTVAIPSSPGSACGAFPQATAYALNVTAVPQGPLFYLSVWPAGQSMPLVSTLNAVGGQVTASAAVVPAGTQQSVSFFATNATGLVIDSSGYFAAPGQANELLFVPTTPCRVVDTRNPNAPLGGPAIEAASSRTFPVRDSPCGLPPNAQAYVFNVTAIPTRSLGFLTVWPAGMATPWVSTLNAPRSSPVANLAIVPAGDSGSISVFASDQTHLVIDVTGYFVPAE